MAVRKFSADQIFTGTEMLMGKVLIVENDGRVHSIVDDSDAGADVERFQGILTPGFINCHCHLELSHMKGRIPEKTGLIDFVFKVVTERNVHDEELQQSIAEAEKEMIEGGIVAVGDICNNTSTLLQKQSNNLRYYNFIEASGWLPAVAQQRFERAKNTYEAFARQNTSASIVPHAPYSVSKELWAQMETFFDGKVISIHNQETKFEDAFFKEGKGDFQQLYERLQIDNSHHLPTGKTSVPSYFPYLMSASSVILVHNTFTTQQDLDYLQQQVDEQEVQVNFCLCPNANLYIEDALPPVGILAKSSFNLCLGTDSLASNHQLSILAELKTILSAFPEISLAEGLRWATLNGAIALQMQSVLGSFDVGKRPGVVCIDASLQHAQRII